MGELNFTTDPSYTSSPGHLPVRAWISSGLIPAVVLSLCFILGIPGNLAVILLKPNWQNMSKLSQSLMLNLAISDFLCLLTLPSWIYSLIHGWPFNVGICKLLAGLGYCCIYGSQLTVTAMSVQRYIVVVQRKSCKQVRKRVLLILLWMAAGILSIPSLVVRQIKTDQKLTRCTPNYSSDAQRVAVLLAETTVGLASLSLVAFSYISLHRRVSQGAFFTNRRTTRLVTSIIVCFFVLWIPYYMMNVLGVVAICLKNDYLLKFCEFKWNITGALSFVNSCMNPLLYAFSSEKAWIDCLKKDPQQRNSRKSRTPDNSTISEP